MFKHYVKGSLTCKDNVNKVLNVSVESDKSSRNSGYALRASRNRAKNSRRAAITSRGTIFMEGPAAGTRPTP